MVVTTKGMQSEQTLVGRARLLGGVEVISKLISLELTQDLCLCGSYAPTMVFFGMIAPAGGRLVNVRSRCAHVSSDGGFFSICS
jgi:hypothetical protein